MAQQLSTLTTWVSPFSNCLFGEAKQYVINAFDTNYLLSADKVMANILHLAQSMEEELPKG
jgi:hypothetical protein